jgi:LPS O-antigen subunit length determinant protein (WzzB/FepE family)
MAIEVGIVNPMNDKKTIDSFDMDPNHLYYGGSKLLKALINNLSNRANHDEAFIPGLDSMRNEYRFSHNYQLSVNTACLYHLDGIQLPVHLISFSKVEMTITSLLLGLLLSMLIILIR